MTSRVSDSSPHSRFQPPLTDTCSMPGIIYTGVVCGGGDGRESDKSGLSLTEDLCDHEAVSPLMVTTWLHFTEVNRPKKKSSLLKVAQLSSRVLAGCSSEEL